MNRDSIVEDYSKSMENYIILMGQITYDETSSHLSKLEDKILTYLHTNFSNMSVSKEELDSILSKIYKTRNFNLKKHVECNLGKAKFEFEDINKDVETIITEEINKLVKLFSSVETGTNFCYYELVNECTREIVGMLIRNHNTISFSKKTEVVRGEIKKMIEQNYIELMKTMGNVLSLRIVNPLELKYIFNKEKVITKV